jgi:hypothetical protein
VEKRDELSVPLFLSLNGIRIEKLKLLTNLGDKVDGVDKAYLILFVVLLISCMSYILYYFLYLS